MWGTKIYYRHMWAWGAVIEQATHEGRSRVRSWQPFDLNVSRLRSWQPFDLNSSFGSYRLNRPVGGRQVLNDLGRRNYEIESCRSLKFMKLRSWQFFDLKSSCGSYWANMPIDGRQVLNDFGRRNYQNESCRSLKFMKLRSWRLFWFEIILWAISGKLACRPPTGRQVLNDLGWRNYQNESCRSLKFMKHHSW
jgi:hypothetical protein